MKKIIFILLLTLVPNLVFAKENYTIKNIQTKINISEESISYSEAINCDFFEINQTITKEIPSNSNNIKVSTNYTKDNNSLNIVNSNPEISKYLIKYELSNKDIYTIELGNNYNTEIKEINFNITHFESLDNYDIEFYLNNKLIKDIDYEVTNSTITGIYNKELTEEDDLVLKIVPKNLGRNTIVKFTIIVPLVLCYLSYFTWVLFGKDREVKVEKTSILIKNINPAEIALLYKGEAKKEDVLFTIVDLANKGFIKIVEEKNDFKLIKLKDYSGKNYKESIFFKNLFKKDINISLSDYVSALTEESKIKKIEYNNEIKISELSNKINNVLDKTLSLINSKEEKNKYFEKGSESKKKYLIVMVAVTLMLVTSLPFVIAERLYLLPISVLFSILTLNILLKFTKNVNFEKLRLKNIFINVAIMVLIVVTLSVTVVKDSYVYFIVYLVGVISSSLMLILYRYMPKRTIHATNVLGKLEGLKELILTGKTKEFERILELNENYFYDILTTTYVMGISEEVINKMTKFKVNAPKWYESKDKFTPKKLNSNILKMNNMILYNIFRSNKNK